MGGVKGALERYKKVCRAAIENEEMEAPEAYEVPTAEEIAAAQDQLGIRFPEDYIQFHLQCEGYRLPFWDIFLLTGKQKSPDHIIGSNLSHRRKPPKGVSLPEHLIAFHDDGSVNLHCFDTTQKDKRGNYAIVTWDHESIDADPEELTEWAGSFTEWLIEQIEDAESAFDDL